MSDTLYTMILTAGGATGNLLRRIRSALWK